MNLELRDLCFKYGEHTVLDSINLHVKEGELLAILGPNGVGKSTLLKCILGILKSYTGQVLLDNREIRKLSSAELSRMAAYIPQAHLAAFDYSVLEIVLMGTTAGRTLFSGPTAEDEEFALQKLDMLGIAGLAHRKYTRISGGERQLALLARALAQGARILVMDEPTANLDFGNQARVMEIILSLALQGYGIVLSTHNPEHAFLWAGRALVLKEGRIAADGDPGLVLTEGVLRELYKLPVKLFSLGSFGSYKACVPANAVGKMGKNE